MKNGELIPRHFPQTDRSCLAIMQSITADIQYLAICRKLLIYSLFKQLSGILRLELSARLLAGVTTN